MKSKLIFVILVLALVLPSWTPAQAQGSASLTLWNRTGETIYLNIKGPQEYHGWLEQGKFKFEYVLGKYTYSYWACNDWHNGKFNLTKKGAEITLTECAATTKADGEQTPAASGTTQTSGQSQIKITNKTGASFYLMMQGPQTYYFTIPSGTTTIYVTPGKYDYKYWACGTWQESAVKAFKTRVTLDLTCNETPLAPFKTPNNGLLLIVNETGKNIILYVVETNKTYNIGNRYKLYMPWGKYNYIAWVGDNVPIYGMFGVSKDKSILTFKQDGKVQVFPPLR